MSSSLPDPRRRKSSARRAQQRTTFDPVADGARAGSGRASGEVRRSTAAARRRRRTDQILAGIGLLMVGAFAAFGLQSLLQGPGATPGPSAAAVASSAPTDDTGAGPTDNPSDIPQDSTPPVSPILEARIPTTIGGSTLTVQSAVDATNLSSGPDGRALNAAMVHLGKQSSDLQIALAYDESGTIDLTIIGFRADGVAAADMRKAVLEAWLAAGTPGVVTTSVTMSGIDVSKVDYGDSGADEYVMSVGDSVFVLETTDATLAQAGVTAILAPPGSSGAPAASAPPEATPAAS